MPTIEENNKLNSQLLDIVNKGTVEELKDLLEINKLLLNKLKVDVLEPDPTIFNKLPIALIDTENNIGTAAFLQAMKIGELNMAGQLAKYGVNLDVKDEEGTTLLMRTIEEEKIREAKFLIKIGADINAQDELGNTPLHFATGAACYHASDSGVIKTMVIKGNPELTEILIKAGVKVFVKNLNGDTELESIMDRDNLDAIAVLLNSDKYTQDQLIKTLCIVSSNGGRCTDLLHSMLEKFKINNMDVNAGDINGLTALDHAIKNGPIDNIEALLEVGARSNSITEHLCKAVSSNRVGSTSLLYTILKIDNIDVNARDIHGLTALDYANRGNNKHKIKALLEAGAHSNDNEGTYDPTNNYIKGYIIAQALIPGIKCVTDLVNGNNYDSTCYSYYKNTYDSLDKLTVKAAFSNAVFGFALFQGFGLFNAMIASKAATDVAESIIKGDFYIDPQSYATGMLQYLGKMGVIILANKYVTDEENVLITTTLLNIAPELIDLGSSIVYQGAMAVDEMLHPIGEHKEGADL